MEHINDRPVGRFAPSPTGRMHLGNVFSALLSWLSAKSRGGSWLLRIEDIDTGRSRRDYALQLMDDLQWLGLAWDGEPLWQSQRSHIYEHYFSLLQQQGCIYPCYCTRADLLAAQAPHESDGRVVYPGTCRPRTLAIPGAAVPAASASVPVPTAAVPGASASVPSRPAAMRLMVPDEVVAFTDGHYGQQQVNLARQVGDFIVRRKDGGWAYQLAVVVDDALSGVTEVVRGRDLLLSSPQQIYVARLLGFPPQHFIHFPLLVNSDGQRLSKRDRSLDMACLREQYSARDIIGMLAHLAGLTPQPQPASPTDLLPLFQWDKVPMSDIVVE